MTLKLSAIHRAGQEPPICRPPRKPPANPFPWPPTYLLVSINARYTSALGAVFLFNAFTKLLPVSMPRLYRAVVVKGGQTFTLTVAIDDIEWKAYWTFTWFPDPGEPSLSHDKADPIVDFNPFYLETGHVWQYPQYVQLALRFTV